MQGRLECLVIASVSTVDEHDDATQRPRCSDAQEGKPSCDQAGAKADDVNGAPGQLMRREKTCHAATGGCNPRLVGWWVPGIYVALSGRGGSRMPREHPADSPSEGTEGTTRASGLLRMADWRTGGGALLWRRAGSGGRRRSRGSLAGCSNGDMVHFPKR